MTHAERNTPEYIAYRAAEEEFYAVPRGHADEDVMRKAAFAAYDAWKKSRELHT